MVAFTDNSLRIEIECASKAEAVEQWQDLVYNLLQAIICAADEDDSYSCKTLAGFLQNLVIEDKEFLQVE